MFKKISPTILISAILLLVALNVISNYIEQSKVDSNKIPQRIEESKGFQRWLTNQKKRMEISVDDFKLKDKNEVYNATFLEVTRLETEEDIQKHMEFVKTYEQFENVAFSPDMREFIDYRHEKRVDYEPNEAHFYGLREDTLINTKILTCLQAANCYFDRAYFIDNHSFVISEVSRNDVTKAQAEKGDYIPCGINDICSYTFKLHFVDLINNARYVYESIPFQKNLSEMIEFF